MLLSNHPFSSPFTSVLKTQPPQDKLRTSSVREQGYTQLEQTLWQGSLAAAVQLAAGENAYHGANTGKCYQCEGVARYYLIGLDIAQRTGKQCEPIPCTADLLELVRQISQMILEHVENGYQAGDWFTTITSNLWALAKQLKDEESRPDYYVSTTTLGVITEQEDNRCDPQETYRRAIRITIYNCRAVVNQHSDNFDKAIVYFRKCIAVRPPTLETEKLLRQSALVALDRLVEQHVSKSRSSSISTSSSTASSSASSSSSCGNCGVEKRSMPVCARCKAKPYCSSRCLVAHKVAHERECKGRKH